MAKNLNSIGLTSFLRMSALREAEIEVAEAKPLPKEDTYSANWLAHQLHPDHQYFTISKVRDLGDGMTCYTLVPDEEKGTDHVAYFYAGQYLSVNYNIDGMPLTRAYSISSSPKRALEGEIEISIKRVKDGLVSNWVQENWKVGTKVDTSGPLGTFTYEGIRDAKNVIGLAGGSGITPFLSFAQAIADGDEDFDLTLLFGCRTEDVIVYKEELDALAAKTDKFKVVYVLSDEEKEGYEHGFLSADLIKKYAPEGEEYSIFMCGPQVMYDFVDKELEKLNLRRKFIRHELMGELHGPKEMDEYPKDREVPETVSITVVHEGISKTVTGSTNDSVLQNLEKNGVAAPSHCRSGECGWCHARLASGEVFCPSKVEHRREADFVYGYIHPCVSFPLTDLVLHIPLAK